MRMLAQLFLLALAAALLVGHTNEAFAVEKCDDNFADCDEAATALQAHRKADCKKIGECESLADKKYDADKATCEAAKKRCEAGDAQKEALKAALKETKAKAKVLASLGGASRGVKAKGKLKTPEAKPPTATALAAAGCADDSDAKAAADALRKRFADARAGGTERALVPAGRVADVDEPSAPRNPPPAAPAQPPAR